MKKIAIDSEKVLLARAWALMGWTRPKEDASKHILVFEVLFYWA